MLVAKEIMTRDVITVTESTSVRELAEILVKHRINGCPVLDDQGFVIGIVTEKDLIYQEASLHLPTATALLDAVIFLESQKAVEAQIRKFAGSTVGDICTRDVVTVSDETSVRDMADLMTQQRIHTLPVVDEEMRLHGIVGRADIVRSMLRTQT